MSEKHLNWLDILDPGPSEGGILSIGCHGQYGVQGGVVCRAEAAYYVEQFPGKYHEN